MTRPVWRITLSLILIVLSIYLLWLINSPKLIHSQDSPFGTLLVFEEKGERCMNFDSMRDLGRQTCINLAQPERLVFDYTRMMMSALYLNPKPANILIIGLGGASLPNALHRVLPDTVIDSVEIDPAVAQAAQHYFAYQPSAKQRLFIEDGRKFIEQAQEQGRRYDMVMLDAFDIDYIPEHLMTVEFLQTVRNILTPQGLLIANTFTQSQLYEQETASYASVFEEFFNLQLGNRVIIAAKQPLPQNATLRHNAQALAPFLAPLGIDLEASLALFTRLQPKVDPAILLHDSPLPQH